MGAPEPVPVPGPARHALVERVLAPGAPEALRLGAAKGALPIPLHDLLFVQIRLLSDPVEGVAAAARESLGRIAEDMILPLLRDAACDPSLLDHFVRSGRLKGEALATVIAHPAIPDATLEALAAAGDADTLRLIITNEVRIIASPRLLQALRTSRNLSPDSRRRLQELERDFIGKSPILIDMAAGSAAPEGPPPAEILPDSGALQETAADPAAESEAPPEFDPLLEQQAEEELRRSDAFQRIMRLSVAERHLLAMKGDAEERTILIRDTARMVSHAVLKNPRISEREITAFAGMRNLHEDILRAIASNREWTKGYAVVLSLVRNPKTPAGLSIQFLARLGTRDLKAVSSDKNVPELVRRTARNQFLVRTEPAKRGAKKAH